MRLRNVSALAFVCVALALPALAAPPVEPPSVVPAVRMRGAISDLDRPHRILTVKNGDETRTFTVPPDALVLTTAAREDFDQLAVGDKVLVQAFPTDPGRAQFVEVLEPDQLVMQLEDLPAIDVADTATVKGVDPLAATLLVSSDTGPQSYRITELTRVHTPTRPLKLQQLTPGERVVVTARNRRGVIEALDVLVVVGPPAKNASP